MEIIFILSGEHVDLPKAEITASLEALNTSFSSIYNHDRVLIIDIPDEESEVIETLGKRLAYTNEICKLLFETDNVSLKDDVQNFQWEKVIYNDYAVRVKKIGIDPDFNSQAMEIEIGGIIKDSLGEKAKVNLENPQTFLRIIISDETLEDEKLGVSEAKPEKTTFSGVTDFDKLSKIFISERLVKRAKKHYYALKPHKRPFFYPGSMSPKLARGMNNLSRIKKGSIVLDPFCGTGGILIEAGIIGGKVVGMDIDEKMVEGTIKNLKYCNINDYEVFKGDARNINLPYKVDAIVTDPPYGISASTAGIESKKIYKESILSMQGILKDDGYICMATPHYLDIHEIVDHTKFKIIEQYDIRMHKSLTRVISVLKKK